MYTSQQRRSSEENELLLLTHFTLIKKHGIIPISHPYLRPPHLLPLLRRLQMPRKNLLPHTLPLFLNNIPMTRHNPLKPPSINPRNTLIKRTPIPTARAIPNRAFLPHRRARRTLHRAKDLRQDTTIRIHARLAKLLGCGQVEHHVCLYERLGGAVVEDDFLVNVRGHVFPIKLGVELWRYRGYGRGLFEDMREGDFFVALLFALFGEGLGAHYLGGWVGFVPGAEEDVVLYACEYVRVEVWDWKCTSASSAVMYLTSPSSETLDFTWSVKATGEKTARAPD